MKKATFLSLLLFIMVFSLNAQPITTTSPNEDDKNGPLISFEKTVHDYGTIKEGGNGVYEFKFKNTGKTPLILTKPQSSCGCTIPEWPKEPILPSKSSSIKVTYDTKKIGVINKEVTVYSNSKEGSVKLSIKGNVVK
ncbi:MAG: DUF1573 domain-containing protein [Bacteroidetes bacterium]|nr:DUF1573 domain-containing protein [Bacteroidota bacterium]